MKITEKVAFNIASEASYVYILSGQKFIKNTKNGQLWRVFENLKLADKTVLPDRSFFNRTKNVEKFQLWKIQMRHFGWFSNIVNVTYFELRFIKATAFFLGKYAIRRNTWERKVQNLRIKQSYERATAPVESVRSCFLIAKHCTLTTTYITKSK